MTIVPDFLCLLQYKNYIKNKLALFLPKNCPHCGKMKLWFWGFYYRKPDRNNNLGLSLNPVPIPRFYCPHCKKTTSALPECISPRRWYIWEKQQEVIALVLSGLSIRSIAKQVVPARSTISRWISWAQNRYREHKDAICNYFPDFGIANNYGDFWKACLKEMLLSKAMYLCFTSGVNVP